MKRIATLLLAAGLVFGVATGASAIDFKASGYWLMSFDYGQNGTFQGKYNGHQKPGYDGQDAFLPKQRVRLKLDAVASENLSGTVYFEINDTWGQAKTGGALGADATNVVGLKNAYVDWMIPETDVKVRMGIQGLAVPSFTTNGGFVLNEDVAGISANAKINEMLGVTAFWARPYNDNFAGKNLSGNTTRDGYMDNMDIFGLLVPMTFDGAKVTPWGIYAATGPNTFKNDGSQTQTFYGAKAFTDYTTTAYKRTMAGMFPVAGAMHRDGTSANNVATRRLNQYGDAWWGGITGEVTMWDPFRLAWDFVYGSSTWNDDGRLNRQGYLMSLLAEYKMDWATPGIYAWYGSGDDSNPADGSERMPLIGGGNSGNDFSPYAFTGNPWIAREAVISGSNGSMVGTWGVGARLKNMSFVENLKHTLRVNYIGGTNSTTMAKKLSTNGLWANGSTLVGVTDAIKNAASIGREGMYLTTGDSALEFGLTSTYKMYENFQIYVDAAYVALWLDTSTSAWGAPHKEGKSIPQTKDAWNINASFIYSF